MAAPIHPQITDLEIAEALGELQQAGGGGGDKPSSWYQRYFIYSYFVTALMSVFSTVSLPWLAGTTLFLVQTTFPNPINGTLNQFSVIGLKSIRVSLARNY